MNEINENESRVLVGILVQQFQPITPKQVVEEAKKIEYDLNYEEVVYTIKNMQRRDLVSVIFEIKNNQRVEAYGMSKPMFKKCPEVAQLKDMLPTLIKSKDAKDFLKQLEGESSGTKKVRELGYRDYKFVKIKFKTVAPIVGGSLNKPETLSKDIESEVKKKESEEKKKNKSSEEEMGSIAYFNRNHEGDVVFTPNQVRQYFLKNLRIAGVGETALNQVDFNEAKVIKNGHKFYLEQWPVLVNGQGRGVKTAEALPSGVEIETEFSFPFTGTQIKDEEMLRKVIDFQSKNGRGFSSYAKKFGKCELVSFEVEKLPWM